MKSKENWVTHGERWINRQEGFASPSCCLRAAGLKGLGVFALRRFCEGETIDRVPVIVLPDPQWEIINRPELKHYYFKWDEKSVAIAFGFVSFTNHSDSPNAKWLQNYNEHLMEWIAIRDIEQNEEITSQYGCPLWFDIV
jgi:SET domain-containing protein